VIGCVQDHGSSVAVPADEEIRSSNTELQVTDEPKNTDSTDKSDLILSELKEISKTLKEINTNLSKGPLPVIVEKSEVPLDEIATQLNKICADKQAYTISMIKQCEDSIARGGQNSNQYAADIRQMEHYKKRKANLESMIDELKGITNMAHLREFVIRNGLREEYKKILDLYK
jgi:hypothetical protein